MARPPLPIGTWGTIRVEQLPAGGWRARARFRDYDGHTRDVERSGATKGAARNALTATLTERSAPSGDEITGDTRLDVVIGVWLTENDTRWAVNTRRRYREVIDDHVLPGVGAIRIREATVSTLDRFVKTIARETGAPTAKLVKSILSGALGLAVRHGAAAANPMRDVAGVTVTSKDPRALSLDEVRAIREAIRSWQTTPKRGRPPTVDLLDVVDVMLATGARIGEVLAIRWADVDLDDGAVTITGTIVMSDDSPSRPIRQAHPKSTSSRRRLSLPAFAVTVLLRRQIGASGNVHDVVFPSASGTLRDPGNVRKQLTKVLTAAGLRTITPHAIRRTVATALDRELDLRAAADQLGHAGTDVTARHYVQRTHQGPDARQVLAQFTE